MPSPELQAKAVLNRLDKQFIHPRMGLPYDMACPPAELPRRSFASPREAMSGIPNLNGYGAGYAWSLHHLALLLDGTLFRLEWGVAAAGDEARADRLMSALHTLLTIGPKGFVPRGLAYDGRAFFPGTDWTCQAALVFALARALGTPALDMAEQRKLAAAAIRWVERLERDQFRLTLPDGQPAPWEDWTAPCAVRGPALLAIGAMAHRLAPHSKWPAFIKEWTREADGRRIAAPLAAAEAAALPPWEGLWRQIALWTLARNPADDDSLRGMAVSRMREYAALLSGRLAPPDTLLPDHHGLDLPYNWRGFARTTQREADAAPAPDAEAASPPAASPPAAAGADAARGKPDGRARGRDGKRSASRTLAGQGQGGGSGKAAAKPHVGTEDDPGFAPPPAWAAVADENARFRSFWAAAASVLLTEDPAISAPHAPDIETALLKTPFERLLTCSPLALAVVVEARGMSQELWEKNAADLLRTPSVKDVSMAASFMIPEYDEQNRHRAGHTGIIAPPAVPARPNGGGRAKRKKKKIAEAPGAKRG